MIINSVNLCDPDSYGTLCNSVSVLKNYYTEFHGEDTEDHREIISKNRNKKLDEAGYAFVF